MKGVASSSDRDARAVAQRIVRQQSNPAAHRQDSVRAGLQAESAVGAVLMPAGRTEDGPAGRRAPGRTSPELICLQTKLGSVIPVERVADLLIVLLPVGESTIHDTIREHQQAIAERIETELGEERPSIDFECREEQGEQLLPDGPTPTGIDGGYVRTAYEQAILK